MKSLQNVAILEALIFDKAVTCATSERRRDVEYISQRLSTEGLSFLTITLPTFCADFDKSLASGKVDRDTCFMGFKRSRKHGWLPAFLQGFTSRVFCSRTGVLLDVPCVQAIQLIRQITSLYKKVNLDCTNARKKAALKKYLSTDIDLADLKFHQQRSYVLADCAKYIRSTLAKVERNIAEFTLRPRHGPGAVATPIAQNAKWKLQTWNTRFQGLFPYDHYGLPNHNHTDFLEAVDFHPETREQPVRVVLVPKTQKTPRVIAIEPLHMQFMQQGLKDELYAQIEGCPIMGGHVNFSDQTINRELAKAGSIDGSYATIDLSEASDRVSDGLVDLLFGRTLFRESLDVLRSRHATVDVDGEIQTIQLNKYASMGSALCFPVEAMAFFIISATAIYTSRSGCSRADWVNAAQSVYVYGDDIIVPNDEVAVVMDWLESFGLKVNTKKSFFEGNFRESCGGEYYAGTWVTPVYLRELPLHGKPRDNRIVSWAATANQLYRSGYWKAAQLLRTYCEEVVGFAIPTAHEDTEGVTWDTYTTNYGGVKEKYCKKRCKTLIKTVVSKPIRRTDELDGVPALHKCFSLALQPDKEHLQETVHRGRVAIKVRWVGSTP